jgi:hypothetical protein
MRFLAGVIVTFVLAGCTTTMAPAPTPAAEESPASPTAVIETYISTTGLKGFFPFEMDEKQYTRAAMSREEHAMKGTGRFTGFLVSAFGPNDDATIVRLDRDRLWKLDLRRKEYTECPVKGCARPEGQEQKPAQGAEQKEPQAKHDPGCVMRISKKNFTVTPTGETRTVNGFDAERYRVAWVVTLRDSKRRTTTSKLIVDVWTTPLTQDMREALSTTEAFDRAYLGKVVPHRDEVVPQEVGRMMTAYLGGTLNARDKASLLAAGKELEKIKGHPVLTRIDWDLEGNACSTGDSDPAGGAQAGQGSANPLSGIAGMLSPQKKGDANAPLLSFTVEVKSLKMEPVRDGAFDVPAGFRLAGKR